MYVDNQGVIALANDRIHHQKRSKHIDVKYHHTRLEIPNGAVSLTQILTDNNVAALAAKLIKF